MPKLPTYSAGGGEYPAFGGRRAGSEDFGSGSDLVAAGRAVQGAASSLMTEFEDQEARKALVGSTAIRAKYNKRLDDAALSGEDTDKIKEEMLNELSQLGGDFQTKRGAQNLELYTAGAEITFDNEAARMKVERAAAEAKVQGSQFLNSAGANVQRDPTRLAQEEAAAEAFAETFRGKIPAHKLKLISDDLKKDLNAAAYTAMARVDPAGTKAKLEGGEGNLSPEQREQGIKNAEHYESVKRSAENYEKERQRREKTERQEEAMLGYTQRIFAGEVGSKIYQQITTDPALGSQGMQHMASVLKQHAKDLEGKRDVARTDPSVFNDVRSRVDLPIGDPRRPSTTGDIWALYGKGLSKDDSVFLEKRLQDNKTEAGQKWSQAEGEFLRNVKPMLDKSTLFNADPDGGYRVQAFTVHVRTKADAMRAAKEDPFQLFNPKSKFYVGDDIPTFQTAMQALAGNLARSTDAAISKTKPRKSLDEILGPKK